MNDLFAGVVDDAGNAIQSINGWTWHHVGFDESKGMIQMQLVPTNLNKGLDHKGGYGEFIDFAGEVLSDVEKAKKVATENPALASAINRALANKDIAKKIGNRAKPSLLASLLGASSPEDVIREAAETYEESLRALGNDATVIVTKYRTKTGLLRASIKIGGKALTAFTVWQVASHAAAGEFEEAGKAAAPFPAEEIISITVLPLGQYISDCVRLGDPQHHQDWARRMGIDPKGLCWGKEENK
jgi:hypothetical protein